MSGRAQFFGGQPTFTMDQVITGDLLVAGPAFLAGRYGVACGALCASHAAGRAWW